MDVIIEFLMELYLSFAIVLTEDKKLKRSTEIFLKLICIVVSTTIFILLYAGISLTFGILGNDVAYPLGIILLSIGCCLLLLQVTVFVITAFLKHRKQTKSDSDECDNK